MAKTDTGGLFVVEDVAEAQERFDRDAILPCGPMFGKHTYASAGVAAEREQAILSAHDLSPESFANFGKLMGGTRRNNLVLLKELQYEWIENSLKLRFTLPSGSYATVLLREIMKMEEMDSPAESTEGEDDE
jgi:tRNA pseudouridine13 synthase